MKRILLFLLLLLSTLVSAQIVNIPDTNFKYKLLEANAGFDIAKDSNGNTIVIDINGDFDIQESEALLVYELNVSGASIGSLVGIEAFENLEVLNCQNNFLNSLDVTDLTELETLRCNNNQLTSLNITGLDNLRGLYCNVNMLSTIDFTGVTDLRWLEAQYNAIVTMDLTSLEDIREVNLALNDLTSLEVAGLDKLEILICNDNLLAALDLTGLDHLEELTCSNNGLTTLDFTGLEEYLTYINCAGNELTDIDVASLINLEGLACNDNHLVTLDLNANINLTYLSCYANQELVTMFIKNGQIETFSAEGPWGENPSLEYICADEEQIAAFLADPELPDTLQINSYCSYEPGGIFNAISGTLRFDAAGDGCTVADAVLPSVKLKITGEAYEDTVFTKEDGTYTFYTGIGSYTVTPLFENDFFTAAPASAPIEFTALDGTVIAQDFCIGSNGAHPDIEVVMAPVTNAQPGFDAVYKIVYKNKGNQVLTGNVMCTWDYTKFQAIVSVDPPFDSFTIDTYTWNYANLQPFESREIEMVLKVNAPTNDPPVNIGDILPFTMTASPAVDDVPEDNTFPFNQVVTGSMDPNNIVCIEGDTQAPETIGNYLHYIVNFENTGNAPATFIVVQHEINADEFDVASLQLIDSSHDVTTRIIGNMVEFRFENINLAAADHGNILFKQKSKSNLMQGDMVSTRANIFFDYNFPILTNDANTTFALLSTGDFDKDDSVKVYPNPSNGVVNISAEANVQSVQLFDVQGRVLQTSLVNDVTTSIDISSRAAGIYFLKITTDTGVKVEQIVKK